MQVAHISQPRPHTDISREPPQFSDEFEKSLNLRHFSASKSENDKENELAFLSPTSFYLRRNSGRS